METAIKENGIIFGAESIRAILRGEKTQTRRVIKRQPVVWTSEKEPGIERFGWARDNYLPTREEYVAKCPYGVQGKRLWVRETWSPDHAAFYPNFPIVYKADPAPVEPENGMTFSPEAKKSFPFRWRSPLHMPRHASRITLEVTAVRVERLQEISEKDAEAEGCVALPSVSATANYRLLWNKINGKKHPWVSNPWVWIIEFRKL